MVFCCYSVQKCMGVILLLQCTLKVGVNLLLQCIVLFCCCSVQKCIGSGEFGDVYRGVWYSNSEDIEIAVKSLKKVSSAEDKVRFLQEAAIMGQFDHPYIVQIYGIVATEDEVGLFLLYSRTATLK